MTAFTERSWGKLLHAAEIRKDDTWDFLLQNGVATLNAGPRFFYHRACYSSYTHTKALHAVQKRRERSQTARSLAAEVDCGDGDGSSDVDSDEEDSCGSRKRRRLTRSSAPRTELQSCLFCQKRTWKKTRRGSEKLTECQTFEAGERILQAATERNDVRIVREMQGGPDPIAAEVVYHHSLVILTTPLTCTEILLTVIPKSHHISQHSRVLPTSYGTRF